MISSLLGFSQQNDRIINSLNEILENLQSSNSSLIKSTLLQIDFLSNTTTNVSAVIPNVIQCCFATDASVSRIAFKTAALLWRKNYFDPMVYSYLIKESLLDSGRRLEALRFITAIINPTLFKCIEDTLYQILCNGKVIERAFTMHIALKLFLKNALMKSEFLRFLRRGCFDEDIITTIISVLSEIVDIIPREIEEYARFLIPYLSYADTFCFSKLCYILSKVGNENDIKIASSYIVPRLDSLKMIIAASPIIRLENSSLLHNTFFELLDDEFSEFSKSLPPPFEFICHELILNLIFTLNPGYIFNQKQNLIFFSLRSAALRTGAFVLSQPCSSGNDLIDLLKKCADMNMYRNTGNNILAPLLNKIKLKTPREHAEIIRYLIKMGALELVENQISKIPNDEKKAVASELITTNLPEDDFGLALSRLASDCFDNPNDIELLLPFSFQGHNDDFKGEIFNSTEILSINSNDSQSHPKSSVKNRILALQASEERLFRQQASEILSLIDKN